MVTEYKVEFKENTRLYGLYEHVISEHGAKPENIDVGWEVIDINTPGKLNRIKKEKAGDGIVQTEEFVEYLSRNYKDLHEEMEVLLSGKKIPWTLNDFDPTTEEDQKLIDQVHAAAGILDKILLAKKLKPENREYQIKKAWGMYLFTLCPPEKELKKWTEVDAFVMKVVKSQGLGEFLPHLHKGGLGVLTFDYMSPVEGELPAWQAIIQRKCNCTEKANILYAVFEEAGLKSIELHVDTIRSAAADRALFDKYSFGDGLKYEAHVAAGIVVGGEIVFFDLSGDMTKIAVPKYFYPASFREMARSAITDYTAVELHNDRDEEQTKKIWQILEEARAFGVDSFVSFTNASLVKLAMDKNDCESAQKYADEAMETGFYSVTNGKNSIIIEQTCGGVSGETIKKIEAIYDKYPFYVPVRDAYIGHLAQTRQYEKAIGKLEEATKKYPSEPTILFELAQLCRLVGQLQKGLSAIEKAVEIRPENISFLAYKTVLCLETENNSAAILTYKRIFELGVMSIEDREDVGELDTRIQQIEAEVKNIHFWMKSELGASKDVQVKFYLKAGDQYLKLKETTKALKMYYNILAFDQKHEVANSKIYHIYMETGNHSAAEQVAEQFKSLTGETLK